MLELAVTVVVVWLAVMLPLLVAASWYGETLSVLSGSAVPIPTLTASLPAPPMIAALLDSDWAL